MMEKINCVQTLPNDVIEKNPNIVGYAIDMMVKKLTEELGSLLCDGNEYIVRMPAPVIREAIAAYNSTEYRVRIEYSSLIRCRDCAKRKNNRFCLEHMRYEDDDGYCSDAERKKSYLYGKSADSVIMDESQTERSRR